jgi:predicted DNA-binding transcriptional regulator YafY
MRADRLLSILLLLQVHRRLTARELAERLEVSERTILRDMEALGTAGVPVVADRGAGGGWRLLEGYRTDLTGLNEDEAQALFLAGPARLLADLGMDRAAQGALLKLLAALPSVSRHRAEHARQRIHIDVSGWSRPEEALPHLPTIQEAVWQDRKLRITYDRGPGCDPVERIADPLGLVAKGSVWYLIAAVDGGNRTYRVSRVRDAEILDEPCVRPEGFDLAPWWERSSTDFRDRMPSYYATVRVHPDTVLRLYSGGRFARIEKIEEEPDPDGWKRVTIRFQFEEEAAEFILSFGPRIEIVEPEILREKVVRLAESVLGFYGKSP